MMGWIKLLQVFSVLLTTQVIISFAWNFCDREVKLCDNHKHFICNLTELVPLRGTTKFFAHIIETDMFRNELLTFHNIQRNNLAGGLIFGGHPTAVYPKASRMREILWDNELAYMARLYTSRVTTQRPNCYNTQRFKRCGFIVGFVTVDDDKDLQTIFTNILLGMWEECMTIFNTVQAMAHYNSKHYGSIANFALMACDKVSKMGCAISMGLNCDKSDPTLGCYFVSCFYDSSLKDNSSVYIAGEPGLDCIDWNFKHYSKYKHLC